MSVHETAKKGFTKGTDAYERGRPSYPADAMAFICEKMGLGPGRTVVDVGAGTGKFTRLLVPSGATVVAVEPVPAMRAKLVELVPGARVLDGTGEAIPLPSGSADAVTIAQAFHWFRHGEALAEVARVLRPGGGLAMVWNSRDRSVPWVDRVSEIIRWNKGQIPTYDGGDEAWLEVIGRSGAFTPAELTSFRLDQELDVDTLCDRVASTSYIATMPDDERAVLLDRVREVVAGFPERFALPYVTYVYWCRRR